MPLCPGQMWGECLGCLSGWVEVRSETGLFTVDSSIPRRFLGTNWCSIFVKWIHGNSSTVSTDCTSLSYRILREADTEWVSHFCECSFWLTYKWHYWQAVTATIGLTVLLYLMLLFFPPLLIKIMNFTYFSPSHQREYCTLHFITESLLIVQFSLLLERLLSLEESQALFKVLLIS